jgi:hypothetical protein
LFRGALDDEPMTDEVTAGWDYFVSYTRADGAAAEWIACRAAAVATSISTVIITVLMEVGRR